MGNLHSRRLTGTARQGCAYSTVGNFCLSAFANWGFAMESVEKINGSIRPIDRYDVGHVQEVIRQAHEELRQLLNQRAEIMKRIGTVKQTISGLANMFGDSGLNEEMMELVERKNSGRQPGFSKDCRMFWIASRLSMTACGFYYSFHI